MPHPLFDLEQLLRSKQENLPSREANVLMACKARAVNDFTVGATAGGAITWLASPRLSNLIRIQVSAVAAAFFGMWRFSRALESCIEHILSLDGSRMQKELANILVTRHWDERRTTQFLSKGFYSEKVFDDSSIDQPRLRWRRRNFFFDNVTSQRRHDSGSYNDNTDSETTDGQNTVEPKLASKNSPMEALTDPLSCVFGLPGSSEEIIHHTDNTSPVSPRRNGRSHRRSHRRHRMHHHHVHEAS